MDSATTIVLLEQARSGDAAARDALFARHAGRLRLYVTRRLGRALGRRVDVDDVCQETYLRVFQALETVDARGENAFYRFLTAIARHALVDAARGLRAAKRSGPEVRLARDDWSHAGGVEPAALEPGPRTRAALTERQRALERGFEALPAHYRRVIGLRQLEQRPAAEVADLIGSTETAVHALYRRALLAWEEATDAAARE